MRLREAADLAVVELLRTVRCANSVIQFRPVDREQVYFRCGAHVQYDEHNRDNVGLNCERGLYCDRSSHYGPGCRDKGRGDEQGGPPRQCRAHQQRGEVCRRLYRVRPDDEGDDGGDEEEQERLRQVFRGYRTSCGEKPLWSQQESEEVDRVVGNELEVLKHVSHNILPVLFNPARRRKDAGRRRSL